jgi:hypothetical protein
MKHESGDEEVSSTAWVGCFKTDFDAAVVRREYQAGGQGVFQAKDEEKNNLKPNSCLCDLRVLARVRNFLQVCQYSLKIFSSDVLGFNMTAFNIHTLDSAHALIEAG